MVEARLEANRERAVECTALSAKARRNTNRSWSRRESTVLRPPGDPSLALLVAPACQLVAGTVLLILTRVGATLTQYRQAESEERRQSEKLKLLDNIKNAKLREHTIAALLTAQPVSPNIRSKRAWSANRPQKRPTKRTKGNAEAS